MGNPPTMNRLRSLCAGLAALGAVALPFAAAAQEYPRINLRFALYISNSIPQAKNFQAWADELKERSGGKITVQFFWSQSLGKASELLDLVSGGAVDLAAPAVSYHAAKLPLVNVTQLPMVFPSANAAQRAAVALSEVKAVKEEHARNKVFPVAWTSLPTYHVLCNKEIRTMKDFKDVKMRSYGEYVPRLWSALGSVGVTVLAPEVYEGLQRGNIDCSYLPNDFAFAYKLHEVAKYYVSANFGAIVAWPIYVNADKWNAWPEHVQKLFLEAGAKVNERDRAEIDGAGRAALEKMLAGGMKTVEFTEQAQLDKTAPDFLAVWIEEMDKRGLGDGAREVADAVRKAVAQTN